jgi:hypothetical protein
MVTRKEWQRFEEQLRSLPLIEPAPDMDLAKMRERVDERAAQLLLRMPDDERTPGASYVARHVAFVLELFSLLRASEGRGMTDSQLHRAWRLLLGRMAAFDDFPVDDIAWPGVIAQALSYGKRESERGR